MHAALQSISQDEMPAGAVLTGWVLVSEWMDTDGERWLTKGHSASKAEWEAAGMHHEALYGDWPGTDDASGG
jgi:hypothetical protein